MKKILVTLLVLAATAGSVSAQLDTTDLKTQITSNFPDNTAGFITPARLRAVALDLMRSNVNKLEDNVISGKLEVSDSVKTLDGFYRWTGSEWASVSDDTTAWARSGGFILPLDYTDKLSIDTARIGGLLYPDGSVNLGLDGVPFDTLYVNHIGGIGGNHNTLDESYDEGGAGLGRTITADAGNVEIIGNIESGMVLTDSIDGSNGVLHLQTNGENRLIMDADGNTFSQKSDASGDMFMGINEIDSVLAATAVIFADYATIGWTLDGRSFAVGRTNNINGDVADLQIADDGIKMGTSGSSTWGKLWLEYDQPTLVRNELLSDPLQNSEIRTYYNHIEIEALNTEIQGSLAIVDGTESEGYVLQSDASGNATWKGNSYGQLYIYSGATAVTVVTAGTFYALTGATVGDTSLVTTDGDDFTIVQDGVYKIEVCGSGTGTPNANATMAVFVDGVRSQEINGATKLSSGGDLESMSTLGILSLTAGDVIDVRITSDGNGDTMTPVYLSFSINQIR